MSDRNTTHNINKLYQFAVKCLNYIYDVKTPYHKNMCSYNDKLHTILWAELVGFYVPVDTNRSFQAIDRLS